MPNEDHIRREQVRAGLLDAFFESGSTLRPGLDRPLPWWLRPHHVTDMREIVSILGGHHAVARMWGVGGATDVYNAIATGHFPARYYLLMVEALKAEHCTAPSDLWGMGPRKRPPYPAG